MNHVAPVVRHSYHDGLCLKGHSPHPYVQTTFLAHRRQVPHNSSMPLHYHMSIIIEHNDYVLHD